MSSFYKEYHSHLRAVSGLYCSYLHSSFSLFLLLFLYLLVHFWLSCLEVCLDVEVLGMMLWYHFCKCHFGWWLRNCLMQLGVWHSGLETYVEFGTMALLFSGSVELLYLIYVYCIWFQFPEIGVCLVSWFW